MSSVQSEHPEYTKNKLKWELVKNVIEDDVQHLLLRPEMGPGRRITWRNKQYIDRAVFINYTSNTLAGLVGMALQKDPEIELPPELEYMLQQATGNRLKLDQLIRQVMSDVIKYGRCVLFVDYPPTPAGQTIATQKEYQPHPYIYLKNPLDVINWGWRNVNGSETIDFVVIREKVPHRPDGFTWQDIIQYRCLYLDDNNEYYYTILDKDCKDLLLETHPDYDTVIGGVYPLQNGKKWDHIPITFVGAEDNDTMCDASPLYPIATVNIGHYRNNAGLEANAIAHGSATLFVTSSLNTEAWESANKGRPLMLGSPEGYFLGETGNVTLCQASPAQLLADMMDQKVEQMVGMGASIMQSANANAPVETTRMQMGSKISKLDTIVSNDEDGITQALKDCALYEGANPELVKVSMSHDFIPEGADATVMRELAAQFQGGIIPMSVVRDYDKRVNLIPREMTDEDLDAAMNEDGTKGLGVFGGPTPEEIAAQAVMAEKMKGTKIA